MKKCLIALLSLFILNSCVRHTNPKLDLVIQGNGNLISEEIPISDYSKIELLSMANLVYEKNTDKELYLRVEVDENLKEYVSVKIQDDVLIISDLNTFLTKNYTVYTNSKDLVKVNLGLTGNLIYKDNSEKVFHLKIQSYKTRERNSSYMPRMAEPKYRSGSQDRFFLRSEYLYKDNYKISTDSKSLSEVRLGYSNLVTLIDSIIVDSLNLFVPITSDLKIGSLQCESLNIKSSGNVSLEGTANNVQINASSLANVFAFDLYAKNVVCEVSGPGKIEINVSDSLKVVASGPSSVIYKGNPKAVEKSENISGSLVKSE